MSKSIFRLFLVLSFISFFKTFAFAQNLSPQELIQINVNPNLGGISQTLTEKGFKQVTSLTNSTESRWYFQPFTNSGEEVMSYLIKSIDSTQKAKTIFCLYNPFNYKDFMSDLVKSRYKFKGIKFIDTYSYTAFEKKGIVFLTRERKSANKETYFEIIVYSK